MSPPEIRKDPLPLKVLSCRVQGPGAPKLHLPVPLSGGPSPCPCACGAGGRVGVVESQTPSTPEGPRAFSPVAESRQGPG